MSKKITVKVATDFSTTPGPRLISEGSHSGELFRNTVLEQSVRQAIGDDLKVVVNLDGTSGYGTSFLEESFGGLIRVCKIPYQEIKERLEVISKEEEWLIEDINEYLLEASEDESK